MSEHADRADELDAEVEDMQHQSDRLKAEIDETRDDWQTKKRDDSVPGAGTGEEAEPEPEPDSDQASGGDALDVENEPKEEAAS